MSKCGPEEVVGLWDTRKNPVGLGGLLTFAAELGVLGKLHGSSKCQIIFAGQPDNKSLIQEVVSGLSGIDGFLWVDELPEIETGVKWPEKPETYQYDSTVRLQEWYTQHGLEPNLSFKKELTWWADEWLKKHGGGQLPVVVHLKNNPKCNGESNADFEEWLRFFLGQLGKEVVFVLIGNEKIDERITGLENTVVTSEYQTSLMQELAFIMQATAFMGMSSGPCNVAIYSRVPYAIFKNPDHHTAIMHKEMGTNNSFSFSWEAQKLWRKKETCEKLQTALKGLIEYAKAKV